MGGRQRSSGAWLPITLTGSDSRLAIDDANHALALVAALVQLEAADVRTARVVALRYFAGLSLELASRTEINSDACRRLADPTRTHLPKSPVRLHPDPRQHRIFVTANPGIAFQGD